jgi:hypothetical protein
VEGIDKMTVLSTVQLIEKRKLHKAKWQKLTHAAYWYDTILPIGTEYKTFETDDFGYVILKEAVGGRKIYKY